VTSPRLVAVVPHVYNGQGYVGDFAWMIEQPTYGRALDHVRGLLATGNYDTPYFRRSASGPTCWSICWMSPLVSQRSCGSSVG
jgi:hypothetical protein